MLGSVDKIPTTHAVRQRAKMVRRLILDHKFTFQDSALAAVHDWDAGSGEFQVKRKPTKSDETAVTSPNIAPNGGYRCAI